MSSSTRRKDSIPEAAARMIAEVVPPARELATKSDIAGVNERIARVEAKVDSMARLQQWMVAFFVPVWAGTFGTLIAVVLKT